MEKRIGVLDIGIGNIGAFERAFRDIGHVMTRVRASEEFLNVHAIVLPGVGAFDVVMDKINNSGIREALEVAVMKERKPILGVCSGMQVMFERSEEGVASGLGWIGGVVSKIERKGDRPVPHMGWNKVRAVGNHGPTQSLEDREFYFLHSYHAIARDEVDVVLKADYGTDINAMVTKENIFGTQFHPEKSHKNGLELLKIFAETMYA